MNKTDLDVKNDVLHSDNKTKLTAEEIAKAVAHHQRNHGGANPPNVPAKIGSGKKNMAAKPK